MRWFLVLTLAACSTYQRATLGPTIGARTGNVGAEVTAEVAGGEGIGFVAAGSGRLNDGLSGGGFRFGVEASKPPTSWGGRITFTMGPTWIGPKGDDDGGATLDARASFAIFHGWDRATEENWANQERSI